MWSFRARHGRLPFGALGDVAAPLESLAASGGHGSPEDFRPILAAARAAAAVRRALASAETPALIRRREEIPDLANLLAHAARLFAADGSVRDDASPKLAELRAKLRKRSSEVSRKLTRILETRRDALTDTLVVLRNDRYCLPVSASARGRVPGIVHDRSGSGQTVFVEPMDVIEANNELALLAAEERREVDRLLAELGREALDAAPDLTLAADVLGRLDALEAKVEFGELAEGRIPEISDDGSWILVGARHPLLDPRLAPLRRRVLGETRAERRVEPLDLELSAGRRLLVVSGPNAGGKTVVLKTAGLFSLLAQSGYPIPAGPGTRLPTFWPIRAEIGDAQAILADRSTFSSSMDTLREILEESGPRALALIDEIGGATDPEEGSALAVAWLEACLAKGGRAIVTTHLSALKAFASQRPDAVCSAMEFDEETGSPTYRLHPGLSGRSHALSVARERGIPETILERAREILGDAWQRRERAETEAEDALERVRRLEQELASERARAAEESSRLASEREAARRDRTKLLEEGKTAFERARATLAREVARELERLREDANLRAQSSADRILEAAAGSAAAAEPVLAEAEELRESRARQIEVGSRARWKGLGTEVAVLALEGNAAWVDASGKRIRVPRSELEPAAEVRTPPARRAPTASGRRASGPSLSGATPEVHVIGERLDEALEDVERALDAALLAGDGFLRIVHGHGTGRLRDGLRERLRSHPAVGSIRPGGPKEGGNGATIVELK